jgi:hypothetical protein
MWGVGMDKFDAGLTRDHLRNELQDFVAESRFGWGQQR